MNLNKNRLFSTLTVFAFLFTLNAQADTPRPAQGPSNGGGGSTEFSRFTQVEFNLLERIFWMKHCGDARQTQEDATVCKWTEALKSLNLKNIRVIGLPQVLGQDGQPREAGNNGTDLITYDVGAWKSFAQSPRQPGRRARLVLHEFAVLAHLESNDSYEVSNALMAERDLWWRLSDLVFFSDEAPRTENWFYPTVNGVITINHDSTIYAISATPANTLGYCQGRGYLKVGYVMPTVPVSSVNLPVADLNSQGEFIGLAADRSLGLVTSILCEGSAENPSSD